MDQPSNEMLVRMPLAESVLLLWQYVTRKDQLQALWDDNRGRGYDRKITFPLMVQLIADALLQYKGSGRRSFEKNREQGTLEASVAAAYGKLSRLPIRVSQAFLANCTSELRRVYPDWAQYKRPKSLSRFHPVVLDGKSIKRVAKRLKPVRGAPGGLLGGRALVALDWDTGLALAMHAHPDGDANEVKFVPELLPVVRQYISEPILWIADRAFCDLDQPARFCSRPGDHFLVRFHPKNSFHPDPEVPERRGTTADGRQYLETWGWLGSEKNKRRRRVRLIRLLRPDEEEDLLLVTDLLDADEYPANDLLWMYGQRWSIENAFQLVTEVFGLEGLIASTPRGCIFQLAFCLVMYNLIQVLRGFIAQAQDVEPEDISTEKLFDDVERQLIAWQVMFTPPVTIDYFAEPLPLAQLQARLALLLSNVWSTTWLKSPPQATHNKTERQRSRTHGSVYRILQDHCRQKAKSSARGP